MANLSRFSAHHRARTLKSVNTVGEHTPCNQLEVAKIKGKFGRCDVGIFLHGERLVFVLPKQTLSVCVTMTAGKKNHVCLDVPLDKWFLT